MDMKKIITLIILAVMVQVGFAQEEPVNEMKTLITGKKLQFTGVFASPELKGTIFNDGEGKDGYGFLVGGRMGVIFNNKFSIGAGGYGLTTDHRVDLSGYPEINDPNARIGFGYGGLVLEYTFFSNKLIHFTIPMLIGGGSASVYKDINISDDNLDWDDFDNYESTGLFVIEPGVNVELNLTKFMRLDLGASYRMVQFSELDYLPDSDDKFSNLAVNASLKLGLFQKIKKEKKTN